MQGRRKQSDIVLFKTASTYLHLPDVRVYGRVLCRHENACEVQNGRVNDCEELYDPLRIIGFGILQLVVSKSLFP